MFSTDRLINWVSAGIFLYPLYSNHCKNNLFPGNGRLIFSGYQFEDIENKDRTVMKDIEIKTGNKKINGSFGRIVGFFTDQTGRR